MTRLLNLLRDARGAAVIELALIAPIFSLMFIGMVDLGRAYSTKLQLEQASQRAIEKVMNGQADTTVATALKTEAATVAGVPVGQVTVLFWLECNGATAASYDMSCSAGQAQRRYLSVEISKTYTPMFTTKFGEAQTAGFYTLVGKTSVRIQ
jgi:Flp pilus assembly protein TadG